ncbi:SPOSA6832_03644 [Sporobolomyces salmonicolor]|uniref:SPOSA6832_03644-mRNA-1:cds n=1 Tax=Sporidiobolus salmonicolor TaxID=5005 RepID=A0A0D6EPJ5_SPOSA|nr:SPOSA6832_03644 [Sporobolomyces salmonicolor]
MRAKLPPPLKRVSSAALSVDDFRSLSTLSRSGPFSCVELVAAESSLTGRQQPIPGKVYVMKTVDRRWAFRMRQQQSPLHELAILRLGSSSFHHSFSSHHSRIPRLIASFLSPTSFHLVLDHAPGGDLWTLLEQQMDGKDPSCGEGLPEEWVRSWMRELVEAVEWLHEAGWAHRDIKPHNLLLLANGHLQLTDFGSAAPITSFPSTSATSPSVYSSIARKYCLALVGTPDYIAPEVLHYAERVAEDSKDFDAATAEEFGEERAYGAEVDWWACGVVMYEVRMFFPSTESIPETYERIVNWSEHLTFPASSSVSRDAEGFIRSFFSSPGLSILRSSPGTADAAKKEEGRYWEAAAWGGCVELPEAGEFEVAAGEHEAPHQSEQQSHALSPAKPSEPSFGSPRWAYETPARPLRRPSPSGTDVAGDAPASSGRSRRMLSDVEAWKEMQEHAWEVGTTAKRKMAPRSDGSAHQQQPPTPMVLPRREEVVSPGQEKEKRVIGSLEKRQKEMVEKLEEMDRKYKGLFELAAKEQEGQRR